MTYIGNTCEYDLTRLRAYFLEVMDQIEPGWSLVYRSSQRLRDFDLAVQDCSNEFAFRLINAWLDDIEKGDEDVESLESRLLR